MNPRMIGTAGPLQGTLIPLTGGEVTVGRDSSNEVWAADTLLSRRHCTITSREGTFSIRDLGSHNGTAVNGIPVRERELQHGDHISVGSSVLLFLLEADELPRARNPVEFDTTSDLPGVAVELREEDAIYLQPEKLIAGFPEAPRLARDLNALLKIATGIGGIRDRESLQWQLLGFLFDIVPAERGAVVFFDKAGEIESTAAWDRARGPEHVVRVSQTIIQRVYRDRAGLIVKDTAAEEALRHSLSLAEAEVRSLLCVPLLAKVRVLGAIYLDSRKATKSFDENHLQIATAVAGIAALALENLQHWEELREENRELRAQIGLEHSMIGESPRMKEVFEFVRRVAPTNATVLLLGESGTGKELVAQAIHRNSPRAKRPFVAINCAAITASLLESELFGHEKGAFTGATAQRKGKMETAEGGTLFLDEISELALELQAKLLRVLQEREFERVGGTTSIALDVRLIGASNRNLSQAVEGGEFRRDLYYRLNVVALSMPALRERREDIPQLSEHFIAKASRKCKTRIKTISPDALACLMNYAWPGNVRELENAIERAIVLGSEDTILPEDFPDSVLEGGATSSDATAKYHGAIKESKRRMILQALQEANGNYIEAAKTLGIHPNSLLRLIRNLDIKAASKAATLPPRSG
ncbi:MAG TPA: sigma 54-interacting transcriptional regulator [Terriglobales bacterium]|nr:sigma 54-interacting transcriptional regulator [Terriglobales bacterium]